jgi:hypothetical protein
MNRDKSFTLSNYPIGMMGLDGLLEEARYFIKGIVREAFEELWEEKNYSPITDTPLLTTEELCNRWNITPDTLHNWEKKGKITKLPLGGRKKMYSLKDIEEAEVSGLVIAKVS